MLSERRMLNYPEPHRERIDTGQISMKEQHGPSRTRGHGISANRTGTFRHETERGARKVFRNGARVFLGASPEELGKFIFGHRHLIYHYFLVSEGSRVGEKHFPLSDRITTSWRTGKYRSRKLPSRALGAWQVFFAVRSFRPEPFEEADGLARSAGGLEARRSEATEKKRLEPPFGGSVFAASIIYVECNKCGMNFAPEGEKFMSIAGLRRLGDTYGERDRSSALFVVAFP